MKSIVNLCLPYFICMEQRFYCVQFVDALVSPVLRIAIHQRPCLVKKNQHTVFFSILLRSKSKK